MEVLQEYTPFVNKLWIPIFNVSTNPASRSKFSPIDDNLLLIGIKKYGPKYFSLHFIGYFNYCHFRDIDKIQKNYLPEKKNSEIRNRYKNLICTRATDNAIKRWKHLQIASLTDVFTTILLKKKKIFIIFPPFQEEKESLVNGIKWYGSLQKLHVISKYFLPDRSANFLEE